MYRIYAIDFPASITRPSPGKMLKLSSCIAALILLRFTGLSSCRCGPLHPTCRSIKANNLRDKVVQIEKQVANAAVRRARGVVIATGKVGEEHKEIIQVCGRCFFIFLSVWSFGSIAIRVVTFNPSVNCNCANDARHFSVGWVFAGRAR